MSHLFSSKVDCVGIVYRKREIVNACHPPLDPSTHSKITNASSWLRLRCARQPTTRAWACAVIGGTYEAVRNPCGGLPDFCNGCLRADRKKRFGGGRHS